MEEAPGRLRRHQEDFTTLVQSLWDLSHHRKPNLNHFSSQVFKPTENTTLLEIRAGSPVRHHFEFNTQLQSLQIRYFLFLHCTEMYWRQSRWRKKKTKRKQLEKRIQFWGWGLEVCTKNPGLQHFSNSLWLLQCIHPKQHFHTCSCC